MQCTSTPPTCVIYVIALHLVYHLPPPHPCSSTSTPTLSPPPLHRIAFPSTRGSPYQQAESSADKTAFPSAHTTTIITAIASANVLSFGTTDCAAEWCAFRRAQQPAVDAAVNDPDKSTVHAAICPAIGTADQAAHKPSLESAVQTAEHATQRAAQQGSNESAITPSTYPFVLFSLPLLSVTVCCSRLLSVTVCHCLRLPVTAITSCQYAMSNDPTSPFLVALPLLFPTLNLTLTPTPPTCSLHPHLSTSSPMQPTMQPSRQPNRAPTSQPSRQVGYVL
jgi:hypothetical protein